MFQRFVIASVAFLGLAAAAQAAVPARGDSVLHVEVVGRGRPMILIPGLSSSGAVWDGAVARYRDRFQCHVVTLGGFAGQPRFEGPFLATAREALLTYIRRERLRAPILVGHSLGGFLALQVAIEAPEDVGSLVIMDALPFLGGAGRPEATEATAREAMEPMRQMIRSQPRERYEAFQRQSPFLQAMVTRPEDLARVTEWGVRSDPVAVADAMFETNTTDLRDRMSGIRAPMLVLGTWYGMRSFTTRAAVDSTFRAQYARAPRWTLALADSARHFLMLDDPDWTWNQVDAFLAEQGMVASEKPRR